MDRISTSAGFYLCDIDVVSPVQPVMGGIKSGHREAVLHISPVVVVVNKYWCILKGALQDTYADIVPGPQHATCSCTATQHSFRGPILVEQLVLIRLQARARGIHDNNMLHWVEIFQ